MLSIDQALAIVDLQAARLPTCSVALDGSLGQILADNVAADIDSPPHHKAMMDGYAVASNDPSPRRLVVAEITAGMVPTCAVLPGQAVRIMTGAPLPAGADSVVPVEQSRLTRDRGEWVEFNVTNLPPGKHVMPRGQMMRAGDIVATAGTTITAGMVGLLAEVGAAQVAIVRRPKVAVLATGNELVPPDATPAPGQIRNSNGPMLAAAARQCGCDCEVLPIARDEPQALAEVIQRGLDADLLLLAGGVSAGTLDLVPGVLASLGVVQHFHKVAMKPGKPLWFGTREEPSKRTLVFGLPGNPVSSFVCFHAVARRAIDLLAGCTANRWVAARLAAPCPSLGDREILHPAVIEVTPLGETVVRLTNWRSSADLRGIAEANALVRLPLASRPPEGDILPVLPLA
jgi:molybdopterin molybdotransferase